MAPYTWTVDTSFLVNAQTADATDVTVAIANIVTALNYLTNLPRCRVRRSATQVIANNTNTAISHDAEWWDDFTMHSLAVAPARITPGVLGDYLIFGFVRFAANATGVRMVRIMVNGALLTSAWRDSAPTTGTWEASLSTVWRISDVADYAELEVYQTSGGDLNLETAEFGVVMLARNA